MNEEFYTKKRWLNWIDKVKETNFKMPESEEGNVEVFVNIMDDVILACLKVIARWEHELITGEEAAQTIDSIRDIVSEEHESLGDDADLMLESLKASLAAVFLSCIRYIGGDYDRNTSLRDLVNQAANAEKDERIDDALNTIAEIGSRVIGGETLPEDVMADMSYCMVAELLDGIDAISAAMIGDNSYKDDDGSEDNEG